LSVANETKVLATGLPSRSMVAVIVEFMVEPAAMVGGFAEMDRDPATIVIGADWVRIPHAAVIVVVPVSVLGVNVAVAYPWASVVAVAGKSVPKIGVAEKDTVSPTSGLPSRVTRAVIVETMVEPAATVGGFAETDKPPEVMVTEVDWVRVPHAAVIAVVPVLVPGVKVMYAYPCALVVAVVEERLPRVGVAEKVTVSPESGFPFKVTRAVIVEVMVDPAATVDGFAEMDKVPEAIVTETDLETPPQVAVVTAVPVVDPGLSVTVAIPLEFVVTVEELSAPRVVVKVTGTLTARIPIASRTVTVIVDVMAEPAAITVGAAVITIWGSLTRTASNGMVCP